MRLVAPQTATTPVNLGVGQKDDKRRYRHKDAYIGIHADDFVEEPRRPDLPLEIPRRAAGVQVRVALQQILRQHIVRHNSEPERGAIWKCLHFQIYCPIPG